MVIFCSEWRLLTGVLVVLALMSGCGGGGGSSSAPSTTQTPPANNTPDEPDEIRFNPDLESGLNRTMEDYVLSSSGEPLSSQSQHERFSSGLAAADYDGDGDVDLYVAGGNFAPNALYENQGDGKFVDVAGAVGVDLIHWGSGPAFGDIDGDGDLDLFIGSTEQSVYLFENRIATDGVFVDISETSGLRMQARNTVSATFYDYDSDGFLDLFLAHWGAYREPMEDTETLWRNNGDRTFTNTSVESGLADGLVRNLQDWSFTPNLADIDGDGDGDLLMSADFGTSQVFVNNGDGTFTRTTDRRVITDQAGMGAAVADFDNDGDMDWFVTSIYSLDVVGGEHFGNRYYRNDGNGVFEDLTDVAGVANGDWGWGACAKDFDNDGNLDLFHVNGWVRESGKNFNIDQVRFFHGDGGGSFEEKATEVGLINTGQGRGVACFDAEGDGDIDIVITNNGVDHVVYYRNESSNDNHYLSIRLQGNGANRLGIGAHVAAVVPTGRRQVRQMGGSNNYVSHNPYEVHFGLGAATEADITVTWPDGEVSTMVSVPVDQQITVTHPHSE